MNSKNFIGKDVYAENEKIGEVKELGIDPTTWTVTHLEIELTKDIAESVLGSNYGERSEVRNMLAISSLKEGIARWTEKGMQLKVSKNQLHMYLRPVV